ncbi:MULTISPECIES: class I SAM-dependent DNA methyltransferase [Streptomyces]|uniref:Methyltransferase n=1 Tax=Streptomyces albus (strain ATCC 21838 / DSM 41398 / FERM P-419 / JCM 4703 / NBRC 107858) TaxID=1081613 RepID=A0A0B5ETX6_STRA4|nr:class I SAM-dependent methyltransferase [Streptomyces sp. SCSIO ZS0520]AJE82690.1 methyltransferase [Streptomyces albus]AOU77003.1 methyltransferase [Streptomyces albus]AYN32779.1 class I SAM-dependent methyltransferase [Streptomyces albus]
MSEAYEGYGDGAAPDRTGQAEAFDAIGARYDDAFPHKEGQLASGGWLAAQLPPGSRVLDVGCGTGLPTARALADAGHAVTGVDLSEGMLELARKNVPEGRFLRRDLAALRAEGPDGLGEFDGIACYFTLLMLPRPEIPYALRQFHRLLRPGGLFALSMVEADLDDAEIPFLGHPIRVSGFLRDELRRVVREAGFEIAGEETFAYAPASTGAHPEHQLFLNCRRA